MGVELNDDIIGGGDIALADGDETGDVTEWDDGGGDTPAVLGNSEELNMRAGGDEETEINQINIMIKK